jgi:hypothetical protein
VVTTFDLSPRVNRHIERIREQAGQGAGPVVHLARDASIEWNPLLVAYWERFGDRIGEPVPPVPAPPGVQVRAVRIRPAIARAIVPEDLNVVLQRLGPMSLEQRFDLVVATNVLVYYDLFEQSLAVANLASMLPPGGLLLTNSPIVELPPTPVAAVGYTDVLYSKQTSARDRLFWYRRR